MPKEEKKQIDSEMPNPIKLSSIAMQGHVALSDGKVDAGGAGLTLDGAERGANSVGFSSDANRISMAFAELLASSLYINTNQGNATSAQTSIEGGEIVVQQNAGTATGQINSITLKDLKGNRQQIKKVPKHLFQLLKFQSNTIDSTQCNFAYRYGG